jgi:hypothetical protein
MENQKILDIGMDDFAYTPISIEHIEIRIIDPQVSEIHSDLLKR